MKKISIIILILISLIFLYTKLDKAPPIEAISSNLIAWKANSEIFEYDTNKLSFHDSKGELQETVILLHGFPTSSYDWHLIWPKLSADYRLVAIDMLGFGFSDKPKNMLYSTAMQADIIEALLKKLNIKKAHLLAHDYGNNIAQELLARSIERKHEYSLEVASIMLLNGALFPESHHPTTIQTLLRGPVGGIVASLTNATLFEKNFLKVFGANTQPTKQDLTDQWHLICLQDGHKLTHKLTYAAENLKSNRERWVDALKQATMPIIFVNGLMDPVSGKETVERYMEIMPDPNVIKLNTIGHYPQLESPELVIEYFRVHVTGAENRSEDLLSRA